MHSPHAFPPAEIKIKYRWKIYRHPNRRFEGTLCETPLKWFHETAVSIQPVSDFRRAFHEVPPNINENRSIVV